MELKQIQCDNLGMSRDLTVSALGKDKSGATNFAFENYNIRIWANTDNTALAVTNERSTKAELTGDNPEDQEHSQLAGMFIGGCKLNKYLIIFTKDANPTANNNKRDCIYRIHYDGDNLQRIILYQGNLNFSLDHPIEAVGYYESEEVQKVYWVDGYNPNRFINIAAVLYKVNGTNYSSDTSKDIVFPDGTARALVDSSEVVRYYYYTNKSTSYTWSASDVHNALNSPNSVSNISGLISSIGTTYNMTISGQGLYANKTNPFDFQGSIAKLPVATITKNYNEAGTFQAGVIQYFFTYYNKYGVETPIIWNSDLQYISMPDRGAKQDESVSCGFDFEIDSSSLDTENYQYLRIYACYRSSLNVIASARLVTEISLVSLNTSTVPTLRYSDLGVAGETVNAADLKYLGGQNIIADTLDYKQDTLFLGNLKMPQAAVNTVEPKINGITPGTNTKVLNGVYTDTDAELPTNVRICECPGISWVYKLVSNHQPEGAYSYKSELGNSQEEIAGFKCGEVYRFGIQFMTPTGEWTNAQWIGDKYCDQAPIFIEAEDLDGSTHTSDGKYTINDFQGTGRRVDVFFTEAGYYIATATVDLTQIFPSALDMSALQGKYVGYRLLMAEMDITSRRIVEQGVINPTMFNYTDRYYNRPFSIPSWIFRPRMSSITNRHYDTLPVQTEANAELQGIMRRKVPGFEIDVNENKFNAYMFIIAANDGGSYMKWKLIYYNSAHHNDTIEAWAASNGLSYNSVQDKMLANYAYITTESQYVLEDPQNRHFRATALYGDEYMVVSSGTIKRIATGKSSWAKVGGEFLAQLLNDIKSKKDPDGNALPLVFSSAMLPDGDLLRKIAYAKGDIAYVTTLFALCVATVAAVVATIFTAGAASAAIAGCAVAITAVTITEVLVSTIVSTLVPLVAGTAIAGMAGVAALAQNKDQFKEADRMMLTKGFVPINNSKDITPVGPGIRTQTAYRISDVLDAYFETTPWSEREEYRELSKATLYPDQDTPFYFKATDAVLQKDDGAIGLDYNAYVSGGILSFTSGEEDDLNNKANVFCVDESIVTLNGPDVEDIANVVESASAYDLNLVGMIPVQSAYGTYDLQCTRGLASGAEVLRNRVVVPDSVPTSNVLGLVNGDFYQDTDISESMLIPEEGSKEFKNHAFNKPVVVPALALYRQWMWNRETSIGMWMPGITLQDPIATSEDNPVYIQEAPSRPTRKLFANMRYSFNTRYQSPFSMKIYDPKVCLDDQAMLKMFRFDGDNKYYYENVNTISVNTEPYGLVKNRTLYPAGEWPASTEGGSAETYIQTAALRDPVQIKYKETPHILIPIQDHEGVVNILPYTQDEEAVTPYKLYDEDIENATLYGTRTLTGGASYRYIHTFKDEEETYGDIIGSQLFPEGVTEKVLVDLSHDINDQDSKHRLIFCFNRELYDNRNTILNDSSNLAKMQTITDTSLQNLIRHAFPDSSSRTDEGTEVVYIINSGKRSLYKLTLTVTKGFDTGQTINPGIGTVINGNIGGRRAAPGSSIGGTTSTFNVYSIKKMVLTQLLGLNNESYTVQRGTAFTKQLYSHKEDVGIYYLDGNQIKGEDDLESIGKSVFSFGTILNYQQFRFRFAETTALKLSDGEIKYAYSARTLDVHMTVHIDYDCDLDNFLIEGKDLTTWDQSQLLWKTDGYPYLFMGELTKKVFDYSTWMGGIQEYALEQLHWNVASHTTPLTKQILSTWGDTYYQRWDCEKTYPFTEDDKNSIVEVLSFMVESHKNLDGRSDVNRGLTNLINLRPTNTMFNPVYSQEDNFFSYSILDEKFKKNIFEADIAWSLTKNNMSDVDSWTSFVATNQMSMDGRFGAVRKIINANDTLLVFQDTGLSAIKYNEETALQTSAGLPLQLGNTGKVTGYRTISDVVGCHNKFSINKNSAGLFFTDDYNKTFMQYTQGGLKDVGLDASFSEWFKENISGNIWTPNSRDAFRTSYDEVTHDLYIITNIQGLTKACLVYNTLLQKFTSFMSYRDTPMITRLNSDSGDSEAFAIRQYAEGSDYYVEAWRLFGGNGYNRIFGNPVSYSMEYRINPDPMHDSIFTNYQFTADWMDPSIDKKADEKYVFGGQKYPPETAYQRGTMAYNRKYNTFDRVEAWNEYQYGEKLVDTGRVGRFPIKSKFRVWRGDIPRDGENIEGYKLAMPDRMRNPWIHLKFTKLADRDEIDKMIFHNLNVTYYNQYGRI